MFLLISHYIIIQETPYPLVFNHFILISHHLIYLIRTNELIWNIFSIIYLSIIFYYLFFIGSIHEQQIFLFPGQERLVLYQCCRDSYRKIRLPIRFLQRCSSKIQKQGQRLRSGLIGLYWYSFPKTFLPVGSCFSDCSSSSCQPS